MKPTKIIYFLLALFFIVQTACTKLDEKFRSELEEGTVNVDAAGLLINAYSSFYVPYQQDQRWVLQEISTDEAMAPTRGGDWDDNGVYRSIHQHTWNADNSFMNSTYVSLTSAVYNATNVLRFEPSAQQQAEARYLRALAMFDLVDLFGVAPLREGDAITDFRIPPKVMQPEEALTYIVTELTAVMNDLPENGPGSAYVANKNAVRALLMKVYLNKASFINRATPSFSAADMNEVISLAKQITASGKYTLANAGHYFDNFAPNNDAASTENIFTLYNHNGVRGGSVDRTWNTIAHYNMLPGGWNGWCTLDGFYKKFEAGDERRGIYYEYAADTTPNRTKGFHKQNVGFFAGQQYNWVTNQPLMARNPANTPLVFTNEVTIRTAGTTLETAGIRPMKYAYDYANAGQKNNDWVVFRYADVLLMQAEAILRGGSGTTAEALTLVNGIRAKRGVSALSSLTLDNLLDERGREMYWEGWRRQDLIRYGKFLLSWEEKEASDAKYLVFPLPSQQIAVNPNLTQNPGY